MEYLVIDLRLSGYRDILPDGTEARAHALENILNQLGEARWALKGTIGEYVLIMERRKGKKS